MYNIFNYIEQTNGLTADEVSEKLYMCRAEYNMLIQNELLLSKSIMKKINNTFKLDLKHKYKLHKVYKSQKRDRENGTCLNTYFYSMKLSEALMYVHNFMKIKEGYTGAVLLQDFCNIMLVDNGDMKYNKQLMSIVCNPSNPISEDTFNKATKYLTIQDVVTTSITETIFIDIKDTVYLAGFYNGELIAKMVLDKLNNSDTKTIVYISDNIVGCDLSFINGFLKTLQNNDNIVKFRNGNILIRGSESFVSQFYRK